MKYSSSYHRFPILELYFLKLHNMCLLPNNIIKIFAAIIYTVIKLKPDMHNIIFNMEVT